MRMLFAAVLTLCSAITVHAQHLVQGVVDGLQDPLVAREASLLVEQQEGVLMARFDVRTRNLMLHVAPASAVSSDLLNQWLAPLGLQVRCLIRRDAREQPFRHLDADRCDEPPLHTR